ncbi:MAG: hypothetical protein LPK19_14610 [Hymenobacteraceae bacterium]|nr:hypothetical protein [Hymenobacteraceae bacterium]MDX5397465.1 hypothetical protein [Hymenobacteraceae bacterium]MDX5513541.1 hypothetical protein [Hymenobacteraceae bacterium]
MNNILKTLLVGKLMKRFGMGRMLAVTAAALLLPYVIKKVSGKDIRQGKAGAILDKLDFSEHIPFLKHFKQRNPAFQA